MATRRNVKSEDPVKSEKSVPEPVAAPLKDVRVQVNVPAPVIAKLLFFTFAMISAPLATYYVSVTKLFVGQSTVAGALAAVAANAVLIAYVIVAMAEDGADADKKSQ